MDKRRIVIRRLDAPTHAELHHVLEMDAACFPGEAMKDVPETSDVWLATWERRVVGYTLTCPATLEDGIFIARQGVLPEYRGNGIQRKMIERVCRWAKKQGKPVVSYTSAANDTSTNNFIRCGFRSFFVPGFSDDGYVCWRRDK